jgi:hypothetical protein
MWTTDDGAEHCARDGCTGYRAGRFRRSHDTNVGTSWQVWCAGIEARLLYGPHMTLVTIAVLLFRRLITQRIGVDDGVLSGRRRRRRSGWRRVSCSRRSGGACTERQACGDEKHGSVCGSHEVHLSVTS